MLAAPEGQAPERVFTYKGKPLNSANTRTWRLALEKASGIKDFRWHDLRHTWATWLRQADVPTWVLQELGGWKSETMVRRYAHLSVKHSTLCRPARLCRTQRQNWLGPWRAKRSLGTI